MTVVRIVKNWDWPDLLRQTPGGAGTWGNIQFTTAPVDVCDYLVVLNRVPAAVTVRCPPDRVWVIIQEPPNEVFQDWHRPDAAYRLVFTSDPAVHGERYCHSHPALPWHVNRDYDMLSSCPVPDKPHELSCVTTNKAVFAGHRARLRFLELLRVRRQFDLFGYGFAPIADKWDGLASYRYSIALENHAGPFYWTEKLADCFLAWAMPLYYGCTNVTDYFPAEALVPIDIRNPHVFELIDDVVRSDLWLKRRDAIAYARELVLNQYQLFPFLVHQIQAQQGATGRTACARDVVTLRVPTARGAVRQPIRERLRAIERRIAGALRH